MPFLVDRRARSRERGLRRDDLHREIGSVVDREVVAVGEVAEPGMEVVDVVDLEVGLDEGLPVDVVFVHAHRVEHVAAEVPVGAGGDLGEVLRGVARPGEQQAVPVAERRGVQLHARLLFEARRAEQLALQVVGPAVHRADDVLGVALALQHDGLAVAADVGEQLDTAVISHQYLGVVHPPERLPVADVRHHQLVAHVVRAGLEQEALFSLEDLRVEVPGNRQVAAGRLQFSKRGNVGHAL